MPHLGEYFTRKTSSKRHNLNIHKGSGEVVSYLQYLAGTNSGRYQVLHPSWHPSRKRLIGMDVGVGPYAMRTEGIVADFMEFSRVTRLQQQQRQQQRQWERQRSSTMSPPSSSPSPEVEEENYDESLADTSPTSPTTTMPMTTASTNAWTYLSSETIAKIAELRRLAYQYGLFSQPEVVVRCAAHFAQCMETTRFLKKS